MNIVCSDLCGLFEGVLAAAAKSALPKKRADVILTGVVIYEAVMEEFDFSELRISTRGLRFAVVMDGA